jgi:Tol biopolymer transport system component
MAADRMQQAHRPRVLVPMNRLQLVLLATLLASCSNAPAGSPAASSGSTPAERPSGLPSTLPSTPPSAGSSELSGQIAYVAGLDPQIFLLDLATGESRQLTELRPEHAELTASGPMRPALSCGFGPWSLTWSPDGSNLAFSYGSCDSVIYVVDLDGALRRIGDGRGPAWSPDGTMLLHGANVPYSPCGAGCLVDPVEPGAWDLRILNLAEEGESKPLTVDGSTSAAGSATWSPDGTTIAYSAPPDGGAGQGAFGATYLIDAAGGQPRWVGNGIWPRGWHPDGRLLVTREDDSSVLAIDLVTGDSSPIGPPQTSTISPDASLVAAWVPDPLTGDSTSRVLTADGEVAAELRGDVITWAPDSSAFAVMDSATSSILILGRDGSLLASYGVGVVGAGGSGSWRPGS